MSSENHLSDSEPSTSSGKPARKTQKDDTSQLHTYKSKLRKKSHPVSQKYTFASMYTEDHKCPIFCIQFNYFVKNITVFACTGSNRVSVYECLANGKLNFLQVFSDSDETEQFFTCAWSHDDVEYEPLIAAAGKRGIIRILRTSTLSCVASFIGHTHEIYDLKVHTMDSNLLFSASKDYSVRLWNIKTSACIAIFGGVEGHRDSILSMDVDCAANNIVTSGVDHAIKIWKIYTKEIKEAMELSYKYNILSGVSFPTCRIHFPDFTTREVHGNYIDCVLWYGDFVISKSCDNRMIFWHPKKNLKDDSKFNFDLIHEIHLQNCDLLFLQFSMDFSQKVIALGNRFGKLMLYNLDVSDPQYIDCKVLTHPQCTTAIRHTAFSRDGSTLMAVCNDGSIWRWERTIDRTK